MKIILKPEPDAALVALVSEELNLSSAVAALLVGRGFTDPVSARNFLYAGTEAMSDPFRLSGMRRAADAIREAVAERKKIVVFGDYDCDGIGAVAILFLTLKDMGADVSYFIPERKTDGYGISWSAVERLFEKENAELIVSVDCGISSYREIERAKKEYRAEFVVTDHHELPETLPDAILVNPHFGSETQFSGAGVALKLAEALTGREAALRFVDICALSTIADVVPLTGENRILVKAGLERFRARKIRPGLKELLRVSGIDGNDAVTARDVAFKLAPRLNAAGRLETAEKSIELLIRDDASELRLLAEALNEDNLRRQSLTESVVAEAKEKLKRRDLANEHAAVLCDAKWDAGVLGIAASRLAESCRRPAVLMTEKDGKLTGSARSVEGVDLFDMLKSASACLEKFGGHAAAAGLTLKKENLEKFRAACRDYLDARADAFDRLGAIEADYRVRESDGVAFYRETELLEPCGMGNPRPVALFDAPVQWNRINDKPHLKAAVSPETELLAFNRGDFLELWNVSGGRYAVAPEVSVFRNRARATLRVRDFEEGVGELSEEILFVRYLAGFLEIPHEKNEVRKRPSPRFGKLLIAYTEAAFREAKTRFPEYRAYRFRPDTLAPENAIVLSPDENTELSYFNEIVFLERPPEPFFRYASDVSGAETTVAGEAPAFPAFPIGVDRLRELYVLFAKRLNGAVFTSYRELWERCFSERCLFLEFSAAFLIFRETGLLNVEKSGIIKLFNRKTEIEKSAVYRSVHGRA